MTDIDSGTTSDEPIAVAVVTGTRAEYGLLRPVMRAIADHPILDLSVIAAGMHLISQGEHPPTVREIEREFEVVATVAMQDGTAIASRTADVQALARGIAGFGNVFDSMCPDVVLVLGDRIEAFAAACAAGVGGTALAHAHGGDRAEGVADESMRHAITKLAHLHFPATKESADRIIRLGEDSSRVHVVGSSAIDDLSGYSALSDAELGAWALRGDSPFAVVLHHPTGLDHHTEQVTMEALLQALEGGNDALPYVLLAPNHDPGRDAVMEAIGDRPVSGHLHRSRFVGLLKRCAVLVGNSSCGLIEAAALGVPVVNIGPRQRGRERCRNVIDVTGPDAASLESIADAMKRALGLRSPFDHPYGDGHAGVRIADVLAGLRDHQPVMRKCNTY
ncbi:MAG: UDP-N-acetylglucosamine 2-epimerase (hydrolyzing) [Planctomycetes bacterium]|nr:UDP-N-acetylglucosamine 2-epimerase (hydrolyzing) [Planctomycetota bacterium]NOG53355.1 UDP-N-acetylglucosamine 2-epimerase (hydrolyzing) [Planctomycetota bacterium]